MGLFWFCLFLLVSLFCALVSFWFVVGLGWVGVGLGFEV